MTRRVLRRLVRVSAGFAVSALACATVASGVLDAGAGRVPAAIPVLTVASVLILVLVSLSMRMRFREPPPRAQRVSRLLRAAPGLMDAQLGLALVAGAFAAIELTGGGRSLAYPVLYGVVAFSVVFQTRAAAWSVAVGAVALELAAGLRGPSSESALVARAAHVGFIGASASMHALFFRSFVARQRREHRERLDREVRALLDEARDYRLIAPALAADSRPTRSREEQEQKLADGAVESLRASIFYTLGLIKRALDARTCALLWLDEDGDRVKIKELVSDSDAVTTQRRVPLGGPVQAVVRDRMPLSLPSVRAAHVPYYGHADGSVAFLGVPVLEGAHLRGVLCADRALAFDTRDAELLRGATEQIVRAIQSEQVFTAVERSKYELERFFHASDMLCRALTLEQVMETAFDAAAQIVDADVAAIALYDGERRRHRVHQVRVKEGSPCAADVEKIAGLEFRENAGLASMVVKNKHYLPATGAPRDPTTPIYTKRVKLRNVESLLVLPLLCADSAIGTFTLASSRPHCFGNDVRDMLGIIANQVAVSLQNAGMYKRMETMATTDGLTGLTNHRAFQEKIARMLERAARHDYKVAVLLTDVDHFKKVNDTYGHPVGDEVLRRVARVLSAAVRKIDIVARYGGEEFVVVLEGTDEEGAVGLAERIRRDVEALAMDSDQGQFKVTMSVGVAGFPDDADTRETLVERADHALYHAKESGRNRVVAHREFAAARNARNARAC